MRQCAICDEDYKESDKGTIQVTRKRGICKDCTVKVVEGLFGSADFNEWLDSFLQSRLKKHVPGYNEYYVRHNKIPCPDCEGTGFVSGSPCKRCGFVGAIEGPKEVCK